MPRSSGQKLKLLVLSKILEEKTDEEHPMTLADMIRLLKDAGIPAERKSLYDDLMTLEDFGMDIVRVKGKRTEYFLGDRAFQLPELRLLVDVVQSSRFLSRKKSEDLIRKLQQLASVHQARSLARQVSVAGRVKSMNESVYHNVNALFSAMDSDQAVSFLYLEWDSEGRRVPRRNGQRYFVSPYLLHCDNENYYLVGVERNSGEVRHFRVDKMQSINQEPLKRWGKEAAKKIDPALYEKRTFGMFGGREETVTLWIRTDLAGVFFDRFGSNLITRKSENGFETTLPIQISPPFYAWLISFGDGVKVLAPDSVREELIDLAARVLKTHGGAV